MPYTKHSWSNNEAVTSAKLNAIEDGIKEINMAYEKNTWARGDVVTADKLNHMEDGIAGGGDSDFSTANMTIVGSGSPPGVNIEVVYIDEDFEVLIGNPEARALPSRTYIVPLYKGEAVAFVNIENNYTVSGNASVDEEGIITITGDFTVSKN